MSRGAVIHSGLAVKKKKTFLCRFLLGSTISTLVGLVEVFHVLLDQQCAT